MLHRWFIFLLAVVAYLAALSNGFVWDDQQLIASDLITGRLPWWQAFTHDFWNLGTVWSDSGGYYRPLTALSLRLDFLLGSGSPLPFHATAIILHGLASVAIYPLAIRFGATDTAARLASLIFALNPHEAETVAWVSGRPDLLMTTALLWALVVRSRWSCVLGVCALLSKETAIVWPLLAALRDRKVVSGRRLVEASLVLAYLATRALVLQGDSVRLFGLEIGAGLRAFLTLLGTWLCPWLTPTAFVPSPSWLDAPSSVWVGTIVLAALALLFVRSNASRPAMLAFLVTHIPAAILMSSRFVLGMRPLYAAAAFLSIAVCIPVSSYRAPLSRTYSRALVTSIAAILTVWCGIVSHRWRDNLSFQLRAAAEAPSSSRVQLNLAVAQRDAGLLTDAWKTIANAQWLAPQPGLLLVKGQLLEVVGCSSDALVEYQRAIILSPNFTIARSLSMRLTRAGPLAPRCDAGELERRFGDSSLLSRRANELAVRNQPDLAAIAAAAAKRLSRVNSIQ